VLELVETMNKLSKLLESVISLHRPESVCIFPFSADLKEQTWT
jgi:hypothetical protein